MKTMSPSTLFAIFALLVLFVHPLHAATAPDLDDQTRAVATELRCVVCQNLSVADSPSEMAQQMRAIVREQLQAGKSPDEIKDFFVSKYGEWVLLKPKTTGFSALLWILPYVVLVLGVSAALWFVRRWVARKKNAEQSAAPAPVSQQIRAELLRKNVEEPDLEDASAKAQLLRERARLRNELIDLDFDFQSGKLSESDYTGLKQEIETKAGTVIQQLGSLPPEPAAKPAPAGKSRARDVKVNANPSQFRRWQIIAGGTFLMLFGLALGVMLTKSVRPRESENDTMTGDFLTGTNSSSVEVRAALNEGKQAFGNQDFPKAIEAFKKVLATDPNNPEAHSYMGFILVQAGHGDGALMAFDKALSQAPNFPMALWGKGMVLYQDKKDYAGAREILERLLNLLPAGRRAKRDRQSARRNPGDRRQLNPISRNGEDSNTPPRHRPHKSAAKSPSIRSSKPTSIRTPRCSSSPAPAPAPAARHSPSKKSTSRSFRLIYSFSQENVMMQGTPFTGKINLTVRLDKDGNPVTRTPGDMTGDYKKNPVEVGTKNVDVVIDQVMQ